jgi:hypothetical protein
VYLQDTVIFCLAYDCGSKAVGEFERAQFIAGWASMPGECVDTS